MRIVLVAAATIFIASGAVAHPTAEPGAAAANAVPPAARPAARVVDAFHAALRRGDTRSAQSLLAGDALIFEEGGVERGKAEYASYHLGADATFSQAVPATVTRRAGKAVGDMAWIATEGRTTGTFHGKAVDRITTETMVLLRAGGRWSIAHIHWSSAAAGR